MCKTFFVAPGHEAVNRGVRHGSGLLLTVEEGEDVEVYATSEGGAGISLGHYRYDQLDAAAPPIGLIRDNRNDTAAYAGPGSPAPVAA